MASFFSRRRNKHVYFEDKQERSDIGIASTQVLPDLDRDQKLINVAVHDFIEEPWLDDKWYEIL